ncbi:phosphoglycerate dehydrogenase [Pseudonocardia asaccharolytica DSM 44247 = NBRC 16224]|uniref:Phosphoglycerate dehydrogenase n=1 Tax=Pseudonocardia asaccharolytica DSM 44247 = NBRC 16224 TaxID=1123024 RepID=A0A511D678_9PSEU|nr:phosphoglycerate dehydrogenase [Pseudonocardia asaccharolytica DSM 44247 = NBRC 16224]
MLVCDQEGLAALADVSGVAAVRYDPQATLPDEAAVAQVLVPPFLATSSAVALTEQLPRLRLVQLLTAGAESWVGRLPAGVALSDCRGAHGGATAEWIVAVLLAHYRDLSAFLRAQDDRRWDYHRTDELAGKRVLLVGAGDVAEHTVRRLAPFEVTTTLVGRRARDGVHGIDEVLDLLPRHDACVVIVPLTDDTRGLVDAEFLAAMPAGAVLVNAARGPVVDTEALTAELSTGRLRAALDVTDPEPLPADHPLWTAPGLLLTPHVGGSVPGAMRRAYAIAAEQIAAFARGERPPNLVENGY